MVLNQLNKKIVVNTKTVVYRWSKNILNGNEKFVELSDIEKDLRSAYRWRPSPRLKILLEKLELL